MSADRDLWQRARPLFDELADLDGDARRARLDELTRSDSALHDLLESLLRADASADDALADYQFGLLQRIPSASGDAVVASSDPLGILGQTVAHFRIVSYLAAGGMGAVYSADDLRLGRVVALKFPLPYQHTDAAVKERFMHEARSAAALDHPNLCTVYEIGESATGVFLAMPLYAGETLRDRLAREGRLEPHATIGIARHVARGLAAAHAAGIVHRDLKPGNVMLVPDGTAKILDFGLAKMLDASITKSQVTRGTLVYMAPDQLRGEGVDARADLWAVGVMLYVMLTGRLPFGGEHEAAILHAILHEQPEPPSRIVPGLTRAFDDLVGALLQKNPAHRYQSAEELLGDLDALDTGAALKHRVPLWTRATQHKRFRRSVLPAGALVAVAIIVLSGGAWAWRTHRVAAPEAPSLVAVLPFVATAPGIAAQTSPVEVQRTYGLNLGFETGGAGANVPAGWFTRGDGYEIVLDTAAPFAGSRSLLIRSSASRVAKFGKASDVVPAPAPFGFNAVGVAKFGVASIVVPVRAPFGKTLRLRGYVRTNGITEGYAGLWLSTYDDDGRMLGLENMYSYGPTGTTPWTAYEVTLPLDDAATEVGFGVLHPGDGAAWFDSLTLSVDGRPWAEGAKPWAPTVDELAWVRRNAIPLANVDAATPTGDLRPLRTMLGDARIVALGEGTRGTSEFFRMKHRLTEFLATTQGFTVFAIEANMPEARRVNDYVLTGRGDPTALLAGMYSWSGNTREVLALIEWMRAYNASGRGRMEFWGFDLRTPDGAIDSVRAFVARADSGFAPVVDATYAPIRQLIHDIQRSRAPAPVSPDEHLRAGAAGILSHLETRRASYVAAGRDSMEVAWAIQYARIVSQSIIASTRQGGRSRDSSMAANVRWMMEHQPTGTKAVLWAHNRHVERRAGAMGGDLDAMYRSAMRVVGFALGEGKYTAIGGRGLAEAPPPGSVESVLRSTGIPRLALDLRAARREASGQWLLGRHDFRAIGSVAPEHAFFPTPVALRYDLLVYLDQTSPTHLMSGVAQQ